MGTWGPEPLENDPALDYRGYLVDSPNGSLLDESLVVWSAVEPELMDIHDCQEIIGAAAVLVGSSEGGVEESGLSWTPSSAQLAQLRRIVGQISTSDNQLSREWKGPRFLEWRKALDGLIESLDDSIRSPATKKGPVKRRSKKIDPKPGDVFRVKVSSLDFAFSQYCCESNLASVLRVLPGLFVSGEASVGVGQLLAESLEPTYRILGDVVELVSKGLAERVCNVGLPKGFESKPPLRIVQIPTDKCPDGWRIELPSGEKLSGVQFREQFPGITQKYLPKRSVPVFPAGLAKLIGSIAGDGLV
jgi:hypothetical protein